MSELATTKPGLLDKFADRYSVDSKKVLNTLKQTCFSIKNGEVSNEQMMALLIVADQYKLNPFTKEIYAFPDKNNGVVPVVGVDGWSRILNSDKNFDGMEFNESESIVTLKDAKPCPEWMECIIYRKDRSRPTIVREYLDEVYQPKRNGYAGPWQSHTKRFLRHKTMIQAARIGFGFVGIYDQDEAERIADVKNITPEPAQESEPSTYSQDDFDTNFPKWEAAISNGKKSADDIIKMVGSKAQLAEEQKNMIRAVAAPVEAEVVA